MLCFPPSREKGCHMECALINRPFFFSFFFYQLCQRVRACRKLQIKSSSSSRDNNKENAFHRKTELIRNRYLVEKAETAPEWMCACVTCCREPGGELSRAWTNKHRKPVAFEGHVRSAHAKYILKKKRKRWQGRFCWCNRLRQGDIFSSIWCLDWQVTERAGHGQETLRSPLGTIATCGEKGCCSCCCRSWCCCCGGVMGSSQVGEDHVNFTFIFVCF